MDCPCPRIGESPGFGPSSSTTPGSMDALLRQRLKRTRLWLALRGAPVAGQIRDMIQGAWEEMGGHARHMDEIGRLRLSTRPSPEWRRARDRSLGLTASSFNQALCSLRASGQHATYVTETSRLVERPGLILRLLWASLVAEAFGNPRLPRHWRTACCACDVSTQDAARGSALHTSWRRWRKKVNCKVPAWMESGRIGPLRRG